MKVQRDGRGTIRDQEPLFGRVASDATAWRTVEAITHDPELLGALRNARRQAREHAWAAGAEPDEPLFIDLDPTLIEAASEKEGAAPTFKGGFGFHRCLPSSIARPIPAGLSVYVRRVSRPERGPGDAKWLHEDASNSRGWCARLC